MTKVGEEKSGRYLRHTKFLTEYSPEFFWPLIASLNKESGVIDAVSLISQSREQILNRRPLLSQCSKEHHKILAKSPQTDEATVISTETSSGQKSYKPVRRGRKHNSDCSFKQPVELPALRRLILDRKQRFSESTKAIMLLQEVDELSAVEEGKANLASKYLFPAKKIAQLANLSLIHICRCRRYAVCRSRWSPYH
eukprot:TRINITY_DN20869_c0_g1_i1.p1 TRINITY_DN20869_c0_g1~~TRINITY_DN20869_c0_g1_i1.p1  ORF type:complete len:196 (+),score=43.47 TRINITY_DN20869_c0_g1_i1:106-693(+)